MTDCNRKTFIAGLISTVAITAVTGAVTDNENNKLTNYYRHMAERYVDETKFGPFGSVNCNRYYAVAPVWFVYDTNNETRKMALQLPAKYRRSYTNNEYNDTVREDLVTKLQTYFAEQHIYEKLNGIKL